MSSREQREGTDTGRRRGRRSERGRRWMDSPSPPDVDSTSKLLRGLNLIGNALSKDMDQKDLWTVVPDSVDRMKMTSQSGASSANEEIGGGFTEAVPERRMHARKFQPCRAFLSDHLTKGNSQDEAEHQFGRASLACLMSEDRKYKISLPTGGTSVEHVQDVIFNENEISFSPSGCFHSSVRRDLRKNTDKEWHLLDNEGIQKVESCGYVNSGADLSKSSVSFCEEEKERLDMLVGGNVQSKLADKGKNIESSANSRGISVLPQSRTVFHGMSWKNEGKKTLVRGGLTSPHSITKTKNSPVLDDSNGIDSSLDRDPRSTNGIVGKGVTVDYDSDLRNGQLCQTQIEKDALSQRNRRLLHNGFVSFCDVGGNACNESSDGSTSQKVKLVIPDTEERSVGKKKGKTIIHDNAADCLQHIKDKTQLNRQGPLPKVTVCTNPGGHPPRLSAGKGWRTALDSIAQVTTALSSEDSIDVPKRKHIMYIDDDSPKVTTSHSLCKLNTGQPTSNLVSGDRSHRRHKMMKGKRKNNFLRAQEGECSSSAIEDSEVLCLESSALPLNQKSTRIRGSRRHAGTSLGPVIEIDELDLPDGANNNSEEQSHRAFYDSSATARQVESDEILARQLQEQLFNELPDLDVSEEIDATIAMALQHEENLSRSARRDQAHPRDFSMAHLYAQYPQVTSRNSSGRTMVGDRATPSQMSHMRRRFNRSADRHNFLNALQAEFNSRSGWPTSPGVLPYQHEFNGNDYEMLLALDDHNRHTGASQRQLDNLPESIVHQSDNIEEACTICLEIPANGETIRHLPCLHKFHKDCIDKWLRRKTFCPVCKSGIT